MRGTVKKMYSGLDELRITPACAGNSAPGTPARPGMRDHPRVCGEQHIFTAQQSISTGSPPRVRGTDLLRAQDRCAGGITPACAGNRAPAPWPSAWAWDHPRVCGEQQHGPRFRLVISGSPPRVRGTDVHIISGCNICRITPACAGNRAILFFEILIPQDHPRVCGEQGDGEVDEVLLEGSPPRVRGTVPAKHTQSFIPRITPACAGNSSPPSLGSSGGWDHPRVCGEQNADSCRGSRSRGSPPRVRGTGSSTAWASSFFGITPACAGNRYPGQRRRRASWDHPRVCGEQQFSLYPVFA